MPEVPRPHALVSAQSVARLSQPQSFYRDTRKGVVLMTYANAEERNSLIAGLRDLADFLEGNPEVPAPRWTDVMVFPSTSTDSGMRTEIDGIATLIGAEIDDQTTDHGHYTTSRGFGPVQYRAVAIPSSSRAYRDSRLSYSENIFPDTDEEVIAS
jgi:hypothetical protein